MEVIQLSKTHTELLSYFLKPVLALKMFHWGTLQCNLAYVRKLIILEIQTSFDLHTWVRVQFKALYLQAGVSGGTHAGLHLYPPASPPGSRSCWSGWHGWRWSWAACSRCLSWWHTDSSQTRSDCTGVRSVRRHGKQINLHKLSLNKRIIQINEGNCPCGFVSALRRVMDYSNNVFGLHAHFGNLWQHLQKMSKAVMHNNVFKTTLCNPWNRLKEKIQK